MTTEMRSMWVWVALLVGVAGCWSLKPAVDLPDVERRDMPVTTDADAGQSDVSDATDVSDAIEMFDATDVSDAADVRDVTDASNVSDATDVTDATNLSDVRDVVDVFGAIDVLDVSDVTDAVIGDSPTMPDVIADASCAAGLVNCGGACANLCAMPTPAPAQRSCAVAGTPGCGMASVAAGTFNMGGDPSAPNSTPVQSNVSVGAFYVDRYEVTVARFRQFASAIPGIGALSGIAQYTRDGAPFGLDYAVAPPYEPTFHSANAACNWSPTAETLEAHPINCVSWSLAMAFCAWDGNTSGGRLPTEAEWEWVARGAAVGSLSSGRTYPWGEAAPTCALANTLGCATSTLPVNASPRGTYGLFDLIGNVYEWTADQYSRFGVGSYWTGGPRTNPLNTVSDTTTGRVTRGGGWEQAPLRSAGRNVTRENGSTTGTTGYPSVGFRCARSAP